MSSPPVKLDPTSGPERYAVTFLGVLFMWFGDERLPKLTFEPTREHVLSQIDQLTVGARRRQKRSHVDYIDAMTYLEAGRLTPRLAFTFEPQLLLGVIRAFGDNALQEDGVDYLSGLPLFRHVRTRLRKYREDEFRLNLVVPRMGPAPEPCRFVQDPTIEKGIHRMLEVHQTARGIGTACVDSEQLMLDAVAVHLHADLEIYYETGFRRIRRCHRELCRAWFRCGPMDARAKFCSTTCRVAHARESVRTPRARPPTPPSPSAPPSPPAPPAPQSPSSPTAPIPTSKPKTSRSERSTRPPRPGPAPRARTPRGGRRRGA